MLYFCRHGETLYNRENRWMGQTDIQLSPEGEAQIHQVAETLSTIEFDEILSSPLQRALRTAEIISEAQSASPAVSIQHWLVERNYGVLEGQEKTEEQRRNLDAFEGVESALSFSHRLSLIKNLDAQSRNILLVSHSGVFRCLITYWGFRSSPYRRQLGHGNVVTLEHR